MDVTDVRIWEHKKGSLLGFADVEFNGIMIVKGFKVWENKDGSIGVSPPTQAKGDEYYPTVKFQRAEEGEEQLPGDLLLEQIRVKTEAKYKSLKGKPKQSRQSKPKTTPPAPEPDNDDIPF